MVITEQIKKDFEIADNKTEYIQKIRDVIAKLSPMSHQPIDNIKWVPISQVHANDYNPNSVAKNEMRLLYMSIKHDGFTQPIVTVYDSDNDKYIIVDGFHRYSTTRMNKDIQESTNGLLPIVVINKDINDRMASTVRHNRARGKHSISGMANMVFSMLENGLEDNAICNELGLEAEELVRLKHVTGFSKLFENTEYRKSWETINQINIRKKYEEDQNDK